MYGIRHIEHTFVHYPCKSGANYKGWKPTLWISAELTGKCQNSNFKKVDSVIYKELVKSLNLELP
jgi:hypothetical protein